MDVCTEKLICFLKMYFFRRDFIQNPPVLPQAPIQPRQHLGAVQQGVMTVTGGIGDGGVQQAFATTGSQQPQVQSPQAAAVAYLLQAQRGSQSGGSQQVATGQPPVMPLQELYSFMMSQGRRLQYRRRGAGAHMPPHFQRR